MKKKLLIAALFAVMLCLSACSKEVVFPENFNAETYTNAAVEVTKGVLQLDTEALTIFSKDADDYVSASDLGFDVDVYKSACSGTLTAMDEAGEPVGILDDISYEVSGIDKDIVTVTIPVQFTDYVVDYEFTFEPNEKAEYNPYVNTYNLTQVVVSAEHTMGELMEQAGMNTLTGMGVVFIVLIFISFIISLFKFLPGSGAKKQAKKEAEKKAEKKAEVTVAAPAAAKPAAEDPMKDQELVAVITAAVIAANGSGSAMVSSDKLVVRSIKRVSR